MARGRRASKEWAEPPKLEADTFRRFVRTVGTARSRLNDANMTHAGEWKKAEPLGIHPQAAKLFCRLDDMEDTKRKDFLRAFDTYREWADWAAQGDMFEEETEGTADAAAEPPEGDGEGAGDDTGREPSEPLPEREPLPDNVEVEADHGEDTSAEATEELANAGYTFADGRQAAIEGRAAEGNPHPETSPAYPIWARGHAQGLRDHEETSADETDSGVVPLNGGRRSRRASAEAVH
jgi:hypothetical protein